MRLRHSSIIANADTLRLHNWRTKGKANKQPLLPSSLLPELFLVLLYLVLPLPHVNSSYLMYAFSSYPDIRYKNIFAIRIFPPPAGRYSYIESILYRKALRTQILSLYWISSSTYSPRFYKPNLRYVLLLPFTNTLPNWVGCPAQA